MRRWFVAAAYLWSTLALAGCSQMACVARDLSRALRPKPTATPLPEATPKPEKASIFLRVTPQVTHAPAEVRITFLVKDPGETLHCPHFLVEYGDGETTAREQSCPPANPTALGYSIPLKNHTYRQAGRFVVKVSVLVGGETVLVETRHVTMTGPDDDPNMREARI